MISYGKQSINQTDIDAVVSVLKSDYLTQGQQVPLFEKTVSRYCNAEYGIAFNSATSALHIACLALDLKDGDWLWTSPNSELYYNRAISIPLFHTMTIKQQDKILDVLKRSVR